MVAMATATLSTRSDVDELAFVPLSTSLSPSEAAQAETRWNLETAAGLRVEMSGATGPKRGPPQDAGLHKKPRQRRLSITASRAFVDDSRHPAIQAMLDVVLLHGTSAADTELLPRSPLELLGELFHPGHVEPRRNFFQKLL